MAEKRGAVASQRKRGAATRTTGAGRGSGPSLPMLRNSERGAVKRCEFAWDLSYNRLLKPHTDMPALRFGSLVHAALADYYVPGVKRGEHPRSAFERHYEADMKANEQIFGMKVGDLEGEEKWTNARELGIAMLDNYVDTYGADDRWQVLVTEYPFQTLVVRPADVLAANGTVIAKKGAPWFYYVGTMDGVWLERQTKELWIPDHKTTDGIGDRKWTHLVLDDQAGGYWSFGVDAIRAAGMLKADARLHGMMYNLLRKAMPDERPSKLVDGTRMYLNQDGSVSKRQPVKYFHRERVFRDEYDLQMARDRARVDMSRIEQFRAGVLDMTKNPGQFTCPMCAYRDACELHETGSDFESFLTETTKTWEPYSAHEIYDGR